MDVDAERATIAAATTEQLEQLERTNRMKATPNMRQRYALVIDELKRRGLNDRAHVN